MGRREDSDSLQQLKSALLDTRASQSLEPVRLPSKLRDRIEKAQRRAVAAKDGVSIFAPSTPIQPSESTPNITLGGAGSSKTGGAQAASTGMPRRTVSILQTGGSPSQSPHQELQPPNFAAALLREKVHLPDAVLGHKMRDFEAKTSTNSLFIGPLDNSFGRLTIDEKERVMQRIQEKIQQITRDIDESFVRIKNELDANGIFDATANYQRAQAICLVELQKRCKLEQLRDEAIREIVDGDEDANATRDSRRHRMSGKLSLLLAHSNQLGHDGADGDAREESGLHSSISGNTKREVTSRHLTAPTGIRNGKGSKKPAKKIYAHLPKLSTESPNQHWNGDSGNLIATTHTRSSDSRVLSSQRHVWTERSPMNRREESRRIASRGFPKDDANDLGGDRGDDALARHPHIAHVLQQMKSGSGAPFESSRSTMNTNGNASTSGSTMDDTRPPTVAKELWIERSKAYQVIAARTVEALRCRFERKRWDTLSYFTDTKDTPRPTISEMLLKRLSARKDAKRSKGVPSNDNGSASESSAREAITEKRKRTDQLYANIQEQIRTRLQCEKKRPPTLSAKSSRSKASGCTAGAGTIGGVGAANGATSNPESTDHERQSYLSKLASLAQGGQVGSLLAASASAPALGGQVAVVDPGAVGPEATPTRIAAAPIASASQLSLRLSLSVPELQESATLPVGAMVRGKTDFRRNTTFEKKLRASQPRVRRKEALIGAPMQTDFSTIGHHSNARMEERRYSAQTWMWHRPGSVQRTQVPHPVAEGSDEDDEENEYGDTFMYEEEQEGDANDNEDEDALENDHDDDTDDASSVAYSFYGLESARSTRSGGSVLTHAVSRKKKMVKKRNGKLIRQTSSSSLHQHQHHASGQTAGSMAMQSRLEEVWRVLEFPFSHKLLMLEKYAELQDADVFQSALASWERAAEIVLIRERMKAVLKEFEEHEEVKPLSRLTSSEWMYLRSLQIDTPGESILQSMTSEDLVGWVRDHMDAVTSRCHKFAHELKATAGEELQFQGGVYPPRL